MNELLWEAREITEEGGKSVWLGTGRDLPGIVLHRDIQSALVFYMSYFPKTDTIQGVIADRYRISVPSQAAAKSIISVILDDLDLPEQLEL